jgi:hypothetical protein
MNAWSEYKGWKLNTFRQIDRKYCCIARKAINNQLIIFNTESKSSQESERQAREIINTDKYI